MKYRLIWIWGMKVKLVRVVLLTYCLCLVNTGAAHADEKSDGGADNANEMGSLAGALAAHVSELITKNTDAYDFHISRFRASNPESLKERLDDFGRWSGFGSPTMIQLHEPRSEDKAGYVFVVGDDQMLCELKDGKATWCVGGLGFSRTPGTCESGWHYRHATQIHEMSNVPGTILACDIQVLYGTGIRASGIALFHLDDELRFVGYLPTKEYVSSTSLDGTALFHAEPRGVRWQDDALRFDFCPHIILEYENGATSPRFNLDCEQHVIDLEPIGLRPAQAMTGTHSGGNLLMDVYEDEAHRLARRDFDGEASVDQAVRMVAAWYEHREGSELLQAQLLLAAYGVYGGKIDGLWGPRTERAFRGVLEYAMALGVVGDIHQKPSETLSLLNWMGQEIFANMHGLEYPD